MNEAHKKPVQLQVNTNGAWKTIVRFDADVDEASNEVIAAAIFLSSLDHGVLFRVATRESLPRVLVYMGQGDWKLP